MTKTDNPFLPIYAQLNAGSAEERYAARPDFPLLLDVELTNHCNFLCRMCETGMRTSPRARGYMQQEIFEKILVEATSHKSALRFIRWGEPTLHPHWLDWLLLAKSKGLLVHFNTNGSLLDKKSLTQLVEGGVDSIKFSFQGVDKASYREMRGVNFFEELIGRIGQLYALRGQGKRPWIQISTTITDETPDAVESFKRAALDVADYVNVGMTKVEEVDLATLSDAEKAVQQKLLARQCVLQRPDACAEVFAKLSVDWDGTVTSCCADNRQCMSVGNLAVHTLSEIWNGEQQRKHQSLLAGNNFDALPLCRKCYVSMYV